MTKNVVHLKDHQFKKGFDPRRNMNGAPRGKNYRYAFGQEMFAKHREELEEVVSKVIQQSINGHEPSQRLCFDYFITKPVADISVESSNYYDDELLIDKATNIPRDTLENIRNTFIDALKNHNNVEEEENSREL